MSEEAAHAVEAALDIPRLVAMGASEAVLASFVFPVAVPVGDDQTVV
jgi:hypothetical protein